MKVVFKNSVIRPEKCMPKQILFVHSGGSQGLHEGSNDLVTYLQHMLGSKYNILNPKMPDPENPEYVRWKQSLGKTLASLEGEVILVGHSLGGSVLLKYLSEEIYNNMIIGLFIIAAPYWGKKDWKVEEYVLRKDFSDRLSQIPKIFLYHSRNDEVVPFRHLAFYASKLPNAIVRKFDSRRHLFSTGIPELIDDIRNLEQGRRLNINKS
jgi:predicted alpha/beta hydrolase family esterase